MLSDMFTFNLASICCSQGLNFTLFSSNINELRSQCLKNQFTLIAVMNCFMKKLLIQSTDSWGENDVETVDVETAVFADVTDVKSAQSVMKV